MLDLHEAISEKTSSLNNENTKTYMDMLIDSGIIAAITFFSTWNGTIDLNQILMVIKATGISFFLQLAYEKGVKKHDSN